MTYTGFLILFTVIPVFFLLIILRKSLSFVYVRTLLLVSVIAFLATTLWDNYAVYNGVWFFQCEKTLGVKILHLPVEEYFFFFLQTYLTGLVQLFFIINFSKTSNNIKLFTLLPITLVLMQLPKLPFGKMNYLLHLLVWGLFFILIQLVFGWKKIKKNIKAVLIPSMIMTLYFSLADSISIGYGIWEFDINQTLGFRILNIPLEEILFFFMTNLLITEAMILFLPSKFLEEKNKGNLYRKCIVKINRNI